MLNNETSSIDRPIINQKVEIAALITPSKEVMIALSKIYVECFNGYPWFENWDVEMAETTLRGYLAKQFTVLYARSGGDVVGLAVAAPLAQCPDSDRFAQLVDIFTSTYLSDVAVAPSAQGCGIGTALVSAFLALSQSRGATCATLRTRENNTGAIKIFKRLGFEECLRYPAETGGVESMRLGFLVRLTEAD